MLLRSLFIRRRKLFVISWTYFLSVILQTFSSLAASGEVLQGIKCRSINFAYASLLFKLIKSVCLLCCVQQGITEYISKLYRTISLKQLPFPTVILFFPSITQYSRSKKIFHA